ncbi:MAG: zinc-binding dehydrogenase [Proteobacteria bacterium]|nr:zinc-binding dehydrogenase [Pseudomonadota bacterium]
MKAAIYHEPKNVTTETVEKPTIGPEGILIRVRSCCICGSDLHMYKLGLFTDILCLKSEGGLIPGHEFSGDVVEVGDQVKDFAVGDRVVAYGNGGLAEYVPVSPVRPGLNVYKIPDEVSYKEGATLEPLANSIHATKKGNPAKGETAMIFGAGIIGLGIVQALKALDLKMGKILVVDVSDKRLEMAKHLGADGVINASREDPYQKAMEMAGGEPLYLSPEISMPKVDIVYDCVGYVQDRPEAPVLQQAIFIARALTGRIVTHGIFEAPLTMDFSMLVGKQIQIIGSYGGWPDDTAQGIELMQTKKIDREQLICHEFSLDQAKEAFDTQANVADSIKVLVNP